MSKKRKNKNLIFVLGFFGLLSYIVYSYIKSKKQKEIEDEFEIPSGVLGCKNVTAKLQNGQAETNKYSALYYNNSHGLIKTSNVWVSLGEVQDVNNFTMYKSFKSYRDGIKANLYNLLYYIYVLNIKKVGDIVVRWVGTKKDTAIYQNYLRNTGFSEDCILDTKEKIRVFFTNMAFAENVKNNTNYIYEKIPSLWNEIKNSGLIKNLPSF
jgi:hypothetical protein